MLELEGDIKELKNLKLKIPPLKRRFWYEVHKYRGEILYSCILFLYVEIFHCVLRREESIGSMLFQYVNHQQLNIAVYSANVFFFLFPFFLVFVCVDWSASPIWLTDHRWYYRTIYALDCNSVALDCPVVSASFKLSLNVTVQHLCYLLLLLLYCDNFLWKSINTLVEILHILHCNHPEIWLKHCIIQLYLF